MTDLPNVGDVVLFQRYAGGGEPWEGEDGKQYRIVSDADLKGVYQ